MSPTTKDRKVLSDSGKDVPQNLDGGRVSVNRYSAAIAAALRVEYAGSSSAVKVVARLVGANGRAVKNWFEERNGPSGEMLIALCRHSDHVMDAVLILSGRADLLNAKRIVDAKAKLQEILAMIDRWECGEE